MVMPVAASTVFCTVRVRQSARSCCAMDEFQTLHGGLILGHGLEVISHLQTEQGLSIDAESCLKEQCSHLCQGTMTIEDFIECRAGDAHLFGQLALGYATIFHFILDDFTWMRGVSRSKVVCYHVYCKSLFVVHCTLIIMV